MLLYNGCQTKNRRNALSLGFSFTGEQLEFEYNLGSQNANADALSRLCSCISKDESCSLTTVSHCLSRDSLYQALRNDPLISQLCKRMSHSEPPPNATSSVVQRYVQLWPQLTVVDGVLCCYKPKSMSDQLQFQFYRTVSTNRHCGKLMMLLVLDIKED